VIPAGGPSNLGIQASKDEEGKAAVTTQCDRPLSSNSDMQAGYRRTWQTRRSIVQSFAFGYAQVSGASVLSEVRALGGTCTSYQLSNENVARKVLGPYAAKPPAGFTDVYAYSEQVEGVQAYTYFGFIARDNLVAVVVSAARNATWAREDFDRMLALAGAALLAA
jgi:hypothetical protein